jgi:hypothetical protein
LAKGFLPEDWPERNADKMFKGERRGGCKRGWGFLFFAFLLLWALPAQAADNAECLKCHKNPGLSKGKKDGSLLSLYVAEAAFQASVHAAAGMGCTDCHQEAKPNFHPAEGFPEVGCTSCHPDAFEAYKKTTHGLVLESGLEGAPKCQDCHTSHYIRKIHDPQSPVQAARLPAVCSKCHEEAQPPKGFLAALATYRITGHRKVYLASEYDTRVCANCHPENAGHPQKSLSPACIRCHSRSAETPVLLGPIHSKMSFKDQPVPFFLRILYGVGLVILGIGFVAFFSFRFYQKKKKEGTDTPGEGNQEGKNP